MLKRKLQTLQNDLADPAYRAVMHGHSERDAIDDDVSVITSLPKGLS